MDILEQVGITKEELIDRIVEKALGITADYKQTGEETWEDIPLSRVVDQKITAAIGNLVESMKPKIQDRINEIMDKEVEKVFSQPFTPVDRFGYGKGETTTIRELIAKEAIEYWTEKVDDNGNKTNGYGVQTVRAEFYAKKFMKEFYTKNLSEYAENMAKEVKAKIPATFAEEVAKSFARYFK